MGVAMHAFILRHNIARFKALLEKEGHEADRRILRELLAKVLRDQAVLESQHEGFQADLDLTQAAVQRMIFRDEVCRLSGAVFAIRPSRRPAHRRHQRGLWSGHHDILSEDCWLSPVRRLSG